MNPLGIVCPCCTTIADRGYLLCRNRERKRLSFTPISLQSVCSPFYCQSSATLNSFIFISIIFKLSSTPEYVSRRPKVAAGEDLWRIVVEEKYFRGFLLRFIVGPPPLVEFMQMKWFVFHICNICGQVRSGKESKEVIRRSGSLDLYADMAVEISEEPLKASSNGTQGLPLVLCIMRKKKQMCRRYKSSRTGNNLSCRKSASSSKSYICKFKDEMSINRFKDCRVRNYKGF